MSEPKEGKVTEYWGRLRGDPIGRRPAGTMEVSDAFGLAGRDPSTPVQDTGGQVISVERGFETGRESASAYYARTAAPAPDPDVVRAEAASVAQSAVRQLEIEHLRAAEREGAVAGRLDAARATVRRIENGGPL